MTIFIFLILFLINSQLSISIIIIPFSTYNPLIFKDNNIVNLIKNANDFDIISTLYTNLIYTNLSISKEDQNYQTFISLSVTEFYLKNLDLNNNTCPEDITGYPNYTYNDNYILKNIFKLNYYNSSKSDTYEFVFDIGEDYYTKYYSFDKGVFANETFFFKTKNNILEKDKIKPINIMFTYRQSVRFDHRPGVIGLGIVDNELLFNLKKAKEINNFEFSIKYKDINKEKGEIIIGDSPHVYDENNFKEKDIRTAKVIKDYFWQWSLIFDIYIPNFNYSFKKKEIATFKIEEFFILGTKEYFELIQNIFFNKYIDEKICFLQKHKKPPYSHELIHFMCYIKDNEKRKKFLNNFPPIIFFQKEMYFNFSLDAKDLFTIIPDGERLLFNIEFDNETQKWELGKPIFKKYQFSFDLDSKLIKYYINSNNEKEKNNLKDGKIVIIMVLTIIIFFIGIVIGKLFCRKYNRKIRANELEENYSYIPKEINKKKIDMKKIDSKDENLINGERNESKLGIK